MMKRILVGLMMFGCLLVACGCSGRAVAPPVSTPDPVSPGHLGDTWTRPADGAVMVYVPAGEFSMGLSDEGLASLLGVLAELDPEFSRAKWLDHLGEEQPAHLVRLDGFWIDLTEVSNAQYRQCVEAGDCQIPNDCDPGEGKPIFGDRSKANHPVVCVDWYGAQDYCAWVGGRLPTEAEWEYGARGRQDQFFPWGNAWGAALEVPLTNLCDVRCPSQQRDAGYDDGYARTAPVGSYPDGASWCGAQDMAGNVAEWVQDWYQWDYYRLSSSQNPTGPDPSVEPHGLAAKVRRGGGWDYPWYMIRVTDRSLDAPDARESELGFRCVVPVPSRQATLRQP